MKVATIAILASLLVPAGAPTARAGAHALPGDAAARHALRSASAAGMVHVLTIDADRVVAHVGLAADGEPDAALGLDSPLRPLSVAKVHLAALWLEHGMGDTTVTCAANATRPLRPMRVVDVLASGCDTAGAEMARILRDRIGGDRVLAELGEMGLVAEVPSDADDATWGMTLSVGEDHVTVTPRALGRFFADIGRSGGPLSEPTRRTLREALDAVVERGTADSIANALDGTGFRIGGKTGTGPRGCGTTCDGWFASLVSDRDGARYVVLVFVRGRGVGGGVAAGIAVAVARTLTGKGVSELP